MHRNLSPASATLVLLAALIAVVVLVACERKPTAQPKVVTVAIREFKFEPATVTVHQGDTVEWKNDDSVPHTATADGQAKSLLSIPAACRREQRGATSQGRKARTTTPAHSTRT